jgi:hypothetical protein
MLQTHNSQDSFHPSKKLQEQHLERKKEHHGEWHQLKNRPGFLHIHSVSNNNTIKSVRVTFRRKHCEFSLSLILPTFWDKILVLEVCPKSKKQPFSELYWQIDINTFTDFKFSNNVNWLVTAVILTPSGTLEQLAYFHNVWTIA